MMMDLVPAYRVFGQTGYKSDAIDFYPSEYVWEAVESQEMKPHGLSVRDGWPNV